MAFSETDLLQMLVTQLKERLPDTWKIELEMEPGPGQADAIVRLSAPDGQQANLVVEARRVLEREVVEPVRASLPGLEYTVDLRGQARDLDVTWLAVRGSFLLAVIIVYLLMSALFESFVVPFVIILSVPLAQTAALAAVTPGGLGILEVGWYGVFVWAGLAARETVLLVVGWRLYSFGSLLVLALGLRLWESATGRLD